MGLTRDEILEQVKQIIAEKMKVDAAEVTPEKHFTRDLGADSLDLVELVMQLEEEFGIGEIPDEVSEKLDTVGAVLDYIEENQDKA